MRVTCKHCGYHNDLTSKDESYFEAVIRVAKALAKSQGYDDWNALFKEARIEYLDIAETALETLIQS